MKVVQNFKSYKTFVGDQNQFGVEISEFVKTVGNSNPNSGKFKFLNWGQNRVSKITFDFP